jgi:hypothetical protein
MKRIFIFLIASFIFSYSQAQVITLDIPDEEIRIVEDSVVNAEQWIRGAWEGKVNKCRERIVEKEVDLSIKSAEVVPAGEAAIVDKYLTRPDYKTRAVRDAEELIEK